MTVDVSERGPGGRWPVEDRSAIATVLGVPPLAAVAVAAAFTGIGVVVDLLRLGTLGAIFTICYLGGCVLAVAWVRRSGLFWPVVSPPLLLAVAVPVVVLLAGDPRPGTGISERLLTIGAPLVNSFPTMAWTTGAVLSIGVARMLLQRPAVEAARPTAEKGATQKDAGKQRTGKKGAGKLSGRRGPGGARGAARTSGSPPRS